MRFTTTRKSALALIEPVAKTTLDWFYREYANKGLISLAAVGRKMIVWANNGTIEHRGTGSLESNAGTDGIATVQAVDLIKIFRSFAQTEPLAIIAIQGPTGRMELKITSARTGEDQTLPTERIDIPLPNLDLPDLRAICSLSASDLTNSIALASSSSHWDWQFGKSLLRLKRCSLRAVGGDGIRFVVFEKQGIKFLESVEPITLRFHPAVSSALEGILKGIGAGNLVIKQTPSGNIVLANEIFECGFPQAAVGSPYPDELAYVHWPPSWRVVISLKELAECLKGMSAAALVDLELIHPGVRLTIDVDRACLWFEFDGAGRARRRAPIVSINTATPPAVRQWYCELAHLNDVLRHAAAEDCYVQISYLSRDTPALLVRYLAELPDVEAAWKYDVESNTRQRSAMFIAAFSTP